MPAPMARRGPGPRQGLGPGADGQPVPDGGVPAAAQGTRLEDDVPEPSLVAEEGDAGLGRTGRQPVGARTPSNRGEGGSPVFYGPLGHSNGRLYQTGKNTVLKFRSKISQS